MRLSTFIDQDGHYYDTVHFTNVVHQYSINGMGIYGCYGEITNRYGVCSLDIIQSKKMNFTVDSRNYKVTINF